MKRAIKYISDAGPIYIHWKKHFCPKCGGQVELRYISKIINSKSPEAKFYDFSLGDTFLVGDVEFRTRCFHCETCQMDISFKDMKLHEKSKRK
ncbi:MAG: hypothetical protein IJB49_02065 [Clostridia bacterium]|nr:hypothetical protein [Clostridia bacterium]